MDGYVVIKTTLDTKDFDAQIKEVEYELNQVEYELSKKKELKLDSRAVSEYEARAEKLKNKLVDLRRKQEDLNSADLKKAQASIDKIGDSTSKVIRKVGKWALAVLSVRSVYSLIRQSISTLSQYNEDLSQSISYIQFALANSMRPVIEWIINAIYEILSAVGRIVYSLSGINIFKNSGIKDFEKSMNRSAGSAKEIKKTIAGFDEMNVLSSSSAGTSGGGGKVGIPDLSKSIQDESKLVGITRDLTDWWMQLGEEMGNALANPEVFEQMYGNWALFFQGLTLAFHGLWSLITGTLEIVGGVMDIIVGIFTGDFELIKNGFNFLIDGILNVLTGALEIIAGVLRTIFGVVVGIFGDIWDGIKLIFSVVATWFLENVINPIGKFFTNLWKGIVNGAKTAFSNVVNFFKNIIKTIVNLFKNIGTKVGDAVSSAFKSVINAILKTIENILNKPINAINKLLDTINSVPGINLDKLNTIKLPRLAVGGIVNMPGRGVPIGGAIAGEVSKEGVIPLTDAQAMQELGQTIGKYITINANITNTMNGRVISRELQKINTNNDFAFNR